MRASSVGGATALLAVIGLVIGSAWYWCSPEFTNVGYEPRQPMAFSHARHAGTLGLDCRFCHNTVERARHAAVPPTSTCMMCHRRLFAPNSKALAPLRAAHSAGKPVKWVRVHMLADDVRFHHGAHVSAGIGCATCHGRVDKMRLVRQTHSLSMRWCMDCHKSPNATLRPVLEVTNMSYAGGKAGYKAELDPQRKRRLRPPLHCSGCHR